ncbi:MAG: tRNA (cytidine(56)-2'-O)-methyltransferase [Candidatus Diapherotrites archaeon CG09_land_8_20_14_0_10_32_12]|nr:MAG: tRNA (cytidine(56)-2'-O)-methyltransferase [Candidatus Diapherotrites archaeon CG09_land_8_20_14_0_10_32_12]
MLIVFRYGHRAFRDIRVTAHCALVSRALGADKLVYYGQRDSPFEESLKNTVGQWGGKFSVEYTDDFLSYLQKKKEEGFKIVHLTMFGVNLPDFKNEIKVLRKENLIVFIGAEKVPGEVYKIADYNVAVGNQPHSEIAALAVFLDRLQEGKELKKTYPGAKTKIKKGFRNTLKE